MFSLNETNRYVLFCSSVDMRKGANSLCGAIRSHQLNPHNGDVYVFINHSRQVMKLLHWERGGYVIYYKRLEAGRFSKLIFKDSEKAFRVYRWDELVLLIEGINLHASRCYRYELCNQNIL